MKKWYCIKCLILYCIIFQWIIKHVKQDLKLLILTVIIPYFILLVSKQVNVAAIVINPYAKTCVPDVVKDLNINLFNLMSRTNEKKR